MRRIDNNWILKEREKLIMEHAKRESNIQEEQKINVIIDKLRENKELTDQTFGIYD